ncbi:107aa long hypothetical protein [Pyrococcus horikoshii OT3]|uniref:Uncharacterized protein n=1 Tax=Pyrococcus horikoshii (strain ATCC 700860 / DSM 12428 / JCM 9974 / NBRC 100139 / OT-3) TaxID=70601 RepID=O58080_PYRHO|nr:107aa long hypothetical protein [Pyrococcus horikoshii OT3]
MLYFILNGWVYIPSNLSCKHSSGELIVAPLNVVWIYMNVNVLIDFRFILAYPIPGVMMINYHYLNPISFQPFISRDILSCSSIINYNHEGKFITKAHMIFHHEYYIL